MKEAKMTESVVRRGRKPSYAARNKAIFGAIARGATTAEMGKKFGITNVRALQIFYQQWEKVYETTKLRKPADSFDMAAIRSLYKEKKISLR